jgi:hypothetical protein
MGRRGSERLPIDDDPVPLGIGLRAGLEAYAAVDGDPSGGEERFSAPA